MKLENKNKMNVILIMKKRVLHLCTCQIRAEKSECCRFQVHLNILVSRTRKFMVWKIWHIYIVACGLTFQLH